MTDITVINFSKGPFEFDQQLFESTPPEEVRLGVIPRLRFSSKSDYVGLQLDITLSAGAARILKTGFLIGLAVRDWSDKLQRGVNLTEDRTAISEICNVGWLVATGVVAQQTDSNKGGFILPPVNMDKLAEEVVLVSSHSA